MTVKKIFYSLVIIAIAGLVMFEEYTRGNLAGVVLAIIAAVYCLYMLIREFRVWTVKGGDA